MMKNIEVKKELLKLAPKTVRVEIGKCEWDGQRSISIDAVALDAQKEIIEVVTVKSQDLENDEYVNIGAWNVEAEKLIKYLQKHFSVYHKVHQYQI